MFSYDTSVHENTKFTPHELVYGKLVRVPSADTSFKKTERETYDTYLRDLQMKFVKSIER